MGRFNGLTLAGFLPVPNQARSLAGPGSITTPKACSSSSFYSQRSLALWRVLERQSQLRRPSFLARLKPASHKIGQIIARWLPNRPTV